MLPATEDDCLLMVWESLSMQLRGKAWSTSKSKQVIAAAYGLGGSVLRVDGVDDREKSDDLEDLGECEGVREDVEDLGEGEDEGEGEGIDDGEGEVDGAVGVDRFNDRSAITPRMVLKGEVRSEGMGMEMGMGIWGQILGLELRFGC